MSIIGSGRLIFIPTAIYLILTIIIDLYTRPLFTITRNHYTLLVIIASILIFTGIVFVVFAGIQLIAAYKGGRLKTDGLYMVCRNPLYASYQFFVIPGICLLFNSWIVLSTVAVLFIAITTFVKKEYVFLEEKFGDEYREYLKRVWIKFI